MARDQRRLAAIVSADVAGYSRLMGNDESGTLAALKAHRSELIDPKITEYGGRIVKTTGDGLLLEFPSVVDAVRCAVDVQHGMAQRNAVIAPDRRIEFRIGINLGDIIIDADDIFGDGVNVAARLQTSAEPGGICVSRGVRDQIADKMKFDFEDLGARDFKNIARSIEAFRIRHELAGEPNAFPQAAPFHSTQMTRRERPRFSIVVLPFANLSGDPDQDPLADAITEDLTTDISRFHNSFVIGHSTAFTFKSRAVDLKKIGDELNVRYVLEGSIRRIQNQVRVNAKLIEAESSSHLWAERFDVDVGNLLELQDRVSRRISVSLSKELLQAEDARSRRERPDNPDAVDLTLRARAVPRSMLDPQQSKAAIRLGERALQLDPEYVDALVLVAHLNASAVVHGTAENPRKQMAAAVDLVDRALTRDPKYANAWHVKAITLRYAKALEQAVAACRKAIELNPNYSNAYAQLGALEVLSGQPESAFPHLEKAVEIDPKSGGLWVPFFWGGFAHLLLGHGQEAVQWLKQSLHADSANVPGTYKLFASAYASMGEIDKAKAALAEYLRRRPGQSITSDQRSQNSDVPAFLKQYERVIDGLRKAGMPEH
jgi:TolB-like protein/class 3 adenylate cyclase/predicted Zn-dependent protease